MNNSKHENIQGEPVMGGIPQYSKIYPQELKQIPTVTIKKNPLRLPAVNLRGVNLKYTGHSALILSWKTR